MNTPLLQHPLEESTVFTATSLMADVRAARSVPDRPLPPVCFLEFDGDLTDALLAQGLLIQHDAWACFHTTMYTLDLHGMQCGMIPRTIGGPYAVLIAEQLAAAGVRLVVGLTSAGRISPRLPIPCLVVADAAVRDEGTSHHYLPPAPIVNTPTAITTILASALSQTGWPVRTGLVWTTDAPYRETQSQIDYWATQNVLAVEMQAASLFAFATARGADVAVIAMVSNAVNHDGPQFNTGTHDDGYSVLKATALAAQEFFTATNASDTVATTAP
jgi:uridine phosphorylase